MLEHCYGVVYCFTSPSGKKYVGQTTDWIGRQRYYKGYFCENQRKFYHALIKYGFTNFKAEILCYVYSQKDLDEMEIWYIKYYDCVENGYNCENGGNGPGKFSDEKRMNMFLSHKKSIMRRKGLWVGIYWNPRKLHFEYKIKLKSKMIESKGGFQTQEDAILARDSALVRLIENESNCRLYMNIPDSYEDIKSGKIKEPDRVFKRSKRTSKYKFVKTNSLGLWISIPSFTKNEKKVSFTFDTEEKAAIMSDFINIQKGRDISYLNFPDSIKEYLNPNFTPPRTNVENKKTSQYKYISKEVIEKKYQYWTTDFRKIPSLKIKKNFKTEIEALAWRNQKLTEHNIPLPD